MKIFTKILAASIYFIVIVSSVSAQEKSDNICVAFQAGLNIASIGNLSNGFTSFSTFSDNIHDGFTSTSTLYGFHIGEYADIKLGRHLYFQPGVQYSSMGSKVISNTSRDSMRITVTRKTDIDVHLAYIQIPLNVSYRFNNGLNVNIGPYLGFNVAAKEEGKETLSVDTKADATMSIYNNLLYPLHGDVNIINTFDFGFNFAIGYLMKCGIGLNAGYMSGLSHILPELSFTISNVSFGTPAYGTNKVIYISLIYELSKK